jgi:hypothetical protein
MDDYSLKAQTARRSMAVEHPISYERTGCCDLCWTFILEDLSDDEDDQSTVISGRMRSVLTPPYQRKQQSSRKHRHHQHQHQNHHYHRHHHEKRSGHIKRNMKTVNDDWDNTGYCLGEEDGYLNSEEKWIENTGIFAECDDKNCNGEEEYADYQGAPQSRETLGITDDSSCQAIVPTKHGMKMIKTKTSQRPARRAKALDDRRERSRKTRDGRLDASKRKTSKKDGRMEKSKSRKPPRAPREHSLMRQKFVKLAIKKKHHPNNGTKSHEIDPERSNTNDPGDNMKGHNQIDTITPQMSIKKTLDDEQDEIPTVQALEIRSPVHEYETKVSTTEALPAKQAADSISSEFNQEELLAAKRRQAMALVGLTSPPDKLKNIAAQLNASHSSEETNSIPLSNKDDIDVSDVAHDDNDNSADYLADKAISVAEVLAANNNVSMSKGAQEDMLESASDSSAFTDMMKNLFGGKESTKGELEGEEVTVPESRDIEDAQLLSQVKSDLSERSISSKRDKVEDDNIIPSAVKIALQPTWTALPKARNRIGSSSASVSPTGKELRKECIGIPRPPNGKESLFTSSREADDEGSIFSMDRANSRRSTTATRAVSSSYSFGTFGKRIRTRSLSRASGNSVS